MITRLFLFFDLLLLNLKAPGQQIPPFVTDSLDHYISREMAKWNLPGIAIAIVKDGKIIVSKGYGVRELGKPDSVTDESIFQIASCSKAFTATALSWLEADKKLSLDDSVRRWMQDFRLYDPLATKYITIRDLLCHRLGLQTFQGDFANWDSKLSRQEIIGLMAKQVPPFGFRSQYGYCNAGFLAAGEIIPLVSGKSWDDFLHDNFFIPLHMQRTSTRYADLMKATNVCAPHSRWMGKEIVIPHDNIDNLGPAASLNSCVRDLAQWIRLQLDTGRYEGKQLIPSAAILKTWTPNMVIPRTPRLFPGIHFQSYGLGWFMADFYGKKIIWHDGGAGGFISNVCFVPELNLGFVILTNSDNNNLCTAIRYQLLDAFTGQPYRNYSALFLKNHLDEEQRAEQNIAQWTNAVKNAGKPSFALEKLSGIYAHPVYGTITIRLRDDRKLQASFEQHPKLVANLEYMNDSTLLCNFNSPLWGIAPAELVFEKDGTPVITLHVSDFLDRMPYPFRRQGDLQK
jgi:CubicO group peptidase (beta-lactamase class C family)